jgi:ABC-2 type transport system permease protein
MRDTSRSVPFLPAARVVFTLSMRAFVGNLRNLVAAVLLGLPVLFALMYRIVASRWGNALDGMDIYGQIVALYLVRNALPLVALFLASSLVADEVEGKSITFLLTRPVPRGSIYVGKLAAYVFGVSAVALPAVTLAFFILASVQGWAGVGTNALGMFRDLGVVSLGVMVYGALFALLGTLLRRPVVPGLVFLFVWESLANLPGWLPRLTISAWLRSLVPYAVKLEGLEALFGRSLPVGSSVVVLLVLVGIFTWLGAYVFGRKEYVLSQ